MDVLIDSRSLSVQIVGKKNIPTYYKMPHPSEDGHHEPIVRAMVVDSDQMSLDVLYTPSFTYLVDEFQVGSLDTTSGIRASKFRLTISPTAYSYGGVYFEEIIVGTDQVGSDYFAGIHPAPPAQRVTFDLRDHVKEIYGEDIVDYEQHDVNVLIEVEDGSGVLLAETREMINPAVAITLEDPTANIVKRLGMGVLPRTPEILELSPGDNKITLRLRTDNGSLIGNSKPDVYFVLQRSNVSYSENKITHYKVKADTLAVDGETGDNVITASLDGRIGDENSEFKLVNGELYEVGVGVSNTFGRSQYSSTKMVTPRNHPAKLKNEKVTTVFSSGISGEVLLLSDVTFTDSACLLTAEISDLDVVTPAHIYWGVVEGDLAGNELYAGGFKGMSNNEARRAKKTWDGERISDGYKVTMNIPKSWFRNEHNGYDSHIQLQARVGQTTKHDADDTETELYGDLLGNPKSAYLVTSEEVVFNQTVGPLKNGIQVIERNASNGRQRFSVAGKGDSPTVTYSYPQKDGVDVSGSISIDSMSGDFVGSMAVGAGLTYENILNGTGYTDIDGKNWPTGGVLTFRATVDDPNGTPAAGGNVQKFATESEVPLYPFKFPTGGSSADIQRTTVNTAPLCSCDISGLSANLNGWSLDSMQLTVFESNNSSNIVVSHPDLSLNSLDGSFNANTDLSYNNWPGRYDCRYTANFSLANMAGRSKTLYGGFMDEPIIANTAVATENNYYNDPVITSARLDASGGRVGMRIQGSIRKRMRMAMISRANTDCQ
jgi:hypothetical protein